MADGTIFDQTQETALTAAHRLLVQDTSAATASQSATFALMGGLEHNAQTVTTADITGAVGQLYYCTIAGLTADRNLTLPASAKVGERIGVYIVDGDDTYELIIKGAATVTINGGSAATEWGRLSFKGEAVFFRCVSSTAWIVENDGRVNRNHIVFDDEEYLQYNDSDTITIKGGSAVVNGVLLSWSDTNKDVGPSGTAPMATANVAYLYLQNSSGSAAWVASTTAPTWDSFNRYWRNGSDANYRCIGWFYVWNDGAAKRVAPFVANLQGNTAQITFEDDYSNSVGFTSSTTTIVNNARATTPTSQTLDYIGTHCFEWLCGVNMYFASDQDTFYASIDPESWSTSNTSRVSTFMGLRGSAGVGSSFLYYPKAWVPIKTANTMYWEADEIPTAAGCTVYIHTWGGRCLI